jgi:hypothetical protein
MDNPKQNIDILMRGAEIKPHAFHATIIFVKGFKQRGLPIEKISFACDGFNAMLMIMDAYPDIIVRERLITINGIKYTNVQWAEFCRRVIINENENLKQIKLAL